LVAKQPRTTGVGFTPKAILLFSNGQTGTGVASHARLSIGMGTSASQRHASWTGDKDASATSVNDTSQQTDQILTIAVETTPTVSAEADLSSLDSDGFTLNYGTADGTAYGFSYLAIGEYGAGAKLTNGDKLLGGNLFGGSLIQ
jgi:hypothetical protein